MTSACRTLVLQCTAYADDELGVDAALEMERHLETCAGCRRAVGRQRQLSRALRELHPHDETPPGVESRVRFALFGATAVRRAATASALVVALAGGGLAWIGTAALRAPAHDARPGLAPTRARAAALRADAAASRGDGLASPLGDGLASPLDPAIAAAAALHREADDGAVPLAVASHDVAAVNAWLRAHAPFAGTIGDPDSAAIALAGATRVMLGAHPAGLVRYRLGERTVSLFLLDDPVWSEGAAPVRVGNVDFRIFQRRGLDLIGWSHASTSYLLVSEDGLTTGHACAACHGPDARGAIAEFVTAVAGHRAATGML